MDFLLNKNKLKINPAHFMRQAGYGFIIDHRTGNETFVKNFTREHYPRFHMYLKDETDRIVFSLHLDQKKAMYSGQHAHNAEYDGPIVEAEIGRLKNLLKEIYQCSLLKK